MRWENTIVIDAPAAKIWELSVDVERWPDVTPTMQTVQRLEPGPLTLGSTARVKQPGQGPAVWTVTRFLPGREFAWETRRLGVTMTGGHRVEETGDGRTRNTLSLEITGGVAKLVGLLIGKAIAKSIRLENEGFRTAAGRF